MPGAVASQVKGKLNKSLGNGLPLPNQNGANRTDLIGINPMAHPGWDALIKGAAECGLFHTSIWARVLRETYGHRPLYLCRAFEGKLHSLLPLMEVSSPLTGRRGVSLPFTDFCLPLPVSDDPRELYASAMKQGYDRGWRYLECRGGNWEWPGAAPSLQFWGHAVELQRPEHLLFEKLDSAVRRAVRKAQKAQLQVDFRGDLGAMTRFYGLHCATRRRHGVPPQPWRFFENIAKLVVRPGYGYIAEVRLREETVAAAVFLHFGRKALYKFGASDYKYQGLRPNNLLLWEAIKRYSACGFARLHLGRTSVGNPGLRRFKLGFGAREENIQYFKYDFKRNHFVKGLDASAGCLNPMFKRLPPNLLRLFGTLIYPHLS